MAYGVLLVPAAARQLADLQPRDRNRVSARIEALAGDPRPAGSRKLEGGEGEYRIRVGDFRVIYSIEDRRLLVLVIRVGHRGDVYRKR